MAKKIQSRGNTPKINEGKGTEEIPIQDFSAKADIGISCEIHKQASPSSDADQAISSDTDLPPQPLLGDHKSRPTPDKSASLSEQSHHSDTATHLQSSGSHQYIQITYLMFHHLSPPAMHSRKSKKWKKSLTYLNMSGLLSEGVISFWQLCC